MICVCSTGRNTQERWTTAQKVRPYPDVVRATVFDVFRAFVEFRDKGASADTTAIRATRYDGQITVLREYEPNHVRTR